MKLTRFCSHRELQSLLREGTITNTTDHYNEAEGGSTSRGFCLSPDPPKKAWKYLNGIVTPGVCVSYEIPLRYLHGTTGKYKGEVERLNDKTDRVTPTYKAEYCTPFLRKEWIEEIIPLETIIPLPELANARYFFAYKDEILRRYKYCYETQN